MITIEDDPELAEPFISDGLSHLFRIGRAKRGNSFICTYVIHYFVSIVKETHSKSFCGHHSTITDLAKEYHPLCFQPCLYEPIGISPQFTLLSGASFHLKWWWETRTFFHPPSRRSRRLYRLHPQEGDCMSPLFKHSFILPLVLSTLSTRTIQLDGSSWDFSRRWTS